MRKTEFWQNTKFGLFTRKHRKTPLCKGHTASCTGTKWNKTHKKNTSCWFTQLKCRSSKYCQGYRAGGVDIPHYTDKIYSKILKAMRHLQDKSDFFSVLFFYFLKIIFIKQNKHKGFHLLTNNNFPCKKKCIKYVCINEFLFK